MRRTIRLTGRRQLPVSAFSFRIDEEGDQQLAAFEIANSDAMSKLPLNAEIRLRLSENKFVEVLRFGTVGNPQKSCKLQSNRFKAPSCQIRVVSRASETEGMLLASTKNWTYTADGESDGILMFQPADIAPRLWKLDVREDEYPILYVDERIDDAAAWARSDPVFTSCVFPHVISSIFHEILDTGSMPDDGWMAHWVAWMKTLMPGEGMPFSSDWKRRQEWIEKIIDTFSARHELADKVLSSLASSRDKKGVA